MKNQGYKKINGQGNGRSLEEILGKKTKILNTNDQEVYKKKIENLNIDDLFSHGMKEYGIKATRSNSRHRVAYEKKCFIEFQKAMIKASTKREGLIERKLPRKKTKRIKLQDALKNGI